MPVKINASTSSGLVVDSDLTGSLKLQTGGNDALSIDSSQVVNFTKQFQIGGVLPPAFSAYASTNQTISSGTFTKINLAVEDFDTNNNFASSRFTPTVAGYYQFNWGVRCEGITTLESALYKNASLSCTGSVVGANSFVSAGSHLVFLNGTTDYVELFCAQYAGSSQSITGNQNTRLSGCLVRAA
jgi:hypothetical protein